jgi:hypothetical protein
VIINGGQTVAATILAKLRLLRAMMVREMRVADLAEEVNLNIQRVVLVIVDCSMVSAS